MIMGEREVDAEGYYRTIDSLSAAEAVTACPLSRPPTSGIDKIKYEE